MAAKLKQLLQPDAKERQRKGGGDKKSKAVKSQKSVQANLPEPIRNGQQTRDQAAAPLNVSGRSVELVEKLEPLIAKRAKANQSAGGGDRKSGSQNSAKAITKPIDTRAELAKLAGVSHDTNAYAAEIKLRAERKCGELLAAMEKRKGARATKENAVT